MKIHPEKLKNGIILQHLCIYLFLVIPFFFYNAQALLTTDLYAAYEMNENAGTVVINALNSSENMVCTGTWITGKLGKALNLTATTQGCKNLSSAIPFDSRLPPQTSTSSFSFTAWVWLPGTILDNGYLFNTRRSAGDGMMDVYTSTSGGNKLNAELRDGGGTMRPVTPQAITGNQWIFIAVTYDNSVTLWCLSINAGAQACNNNPATVAIPDQRFPYGYTHNSNFGFAGAIDQLLIYKRAISTAEITQLYNSGVGLEYPFSTFSSNFTFVNQTPQDVTSTNIFGSSVNMTYYLVDWNISNVTIFYKTNSTLRPCLNFLNGTCSSGYTEKNYTVNASNNYVFELEDNQVYPGYQQMTEDVFETTAHTKATNTNGNKVISVQIHNMTALSNFTFIEVMYRNNSPTSSGSQVYYCNSTYTTGSVATSSNCAFFHTIQPYNNYNHSHSANSNHTVITVPVVNGNIGSVHVTADSRFIFRGVASAAANWDYFYINNVTCTDCFKSSSNLGGSYSNIAGTLDFHIHQFDTDDNLWYYGQYCLNNKTCITNNSATPRYDNLNLSFLPPVGSVFTAPAEGVYSGNLAVSWTNCSSPTGNLFHFNLTLLNYTTSLYIAGLLNASDLLSYTLNTALYPDSQYYLQLNCTDNHTQTDTEYSLNFTTDNTVPYLKVLAPANDTIMRFNFSINFSISDQHLGDCVYSLNDSANVTFNCSLNITSFPYLQGWNNITFCANDTLGNTNCTDIGIYVDTQLPVIIWTSPANDNSTITLKDDSFNVLLRFEDENLYAYNVSIYNPLGTQYYFYNLSGITVDVIDFVQTIVPNLTGNWTVNATIVDGHTAQAIEDYAYSVDNQKIMFDFNDYSNIEDDIFIYNMSNRDLREKYNRNVSITYIGGRPLRSTNVAKQDDRYVFEYDFIDKPKEEYTVEKFKVECADMRYLPYSRYKAHFVCWQTRKWIDFESELKLSYYVEACGNDCYYVNIKTPASETLKFSSIGDLNTVSEIRHFTVSLEVPTNTTLSLNTCPSTVQGQMALWLVTLIILFFIYLSFKFMTSIIGICASIGLLVLSWTVVGCSGLIGYLLAVIGLGCIMAFMFKHWY